VSHDDNNLEDKPLFETAYLSVLSEIPDLTENGIILLVDIKNYSQELLGELNSVLENHGNRLVSREFPNEASDKIKVIVSGEIPREEIINDPSSKYLFIDGRLTDFDLNAPSDLVPLISIDVTDLTNSNIKNQEAVIEAIEQVHDKGKMIRLWKTNDKESVWLTLIELDVDILGVDEIEDFCGIMKKNDLLH